MCSLLPVLKFVNHAIENTLIQYAPNTRSIRAQNALNIHGGRRMVSAEEGSVRKAL